MTENVVAAIRAKRDAYEEAEFRNEAIGEGVCPDCARDLIVTKRPGFFERLSYNPRTYMKCTGCGRDHVYVLPTIYGS